jgi:hypothetical protein
MPERRLPVRPDLDQLRHQAKDLLRAIQDRDPAAVADLQQYHPDNIDPAGAKLADAQLVLARSYSARSWPRLVQACRLVDAIWDDDIDTVRALVLEHPNLLHESALVRTSNWGSPIAYAANVGRDRIIRMLHDLGAKDLQHALDRAVLQGRIGTARMLHEMLGKPRPPRSLLDGPAYTLSSAGTALLFELGVEMVDEVGNPDAPVYVVLDTDSRKPDAKHAILEMYASHGFEFPDTPTMALHRGRIDLLERHLRRDASLLTRTFSYAEIFPPELKCRQPKPGGFDEGFPRTPLAGTTLLHICVEFDELEIAQWLLDQGMNPDVSAAIDGRGFGGHTALFGAVVSYRNFWMNFTGGWAHSRKPKDSPFARLLLERGANPNARASLRELGYDADDPVREHRDVTPLAWGERFQNKLVVSEPAMRMIAERGGHR